MEVVILESARKHGLTDDQIRHALQYPLDFFEGDDDLLMVIGPDPSGSLLEVGIVESTHAIVVVHSMGARPKYLR